MPRSLQVSAVVRLFLALWLAITPTFVWAGSMMLLGVGGGAVAGTPFSLTWISPISQNLTSGTSFSFAAQNLGATDPTRIIAIGIAHGATAPTNVSTVTVGGNAATQATSAAAHSSGTNTDIWYYADAGALGTSTTIVVTTSGTESRCAITVYRVIGTGASFSAANGNFESSALTTLATAATVPAGGGAIAVVNLHNTAGSVTNGGNLTIDGGIAFGTETIGSGSNTSASGSTTFTFNWTGGTDASMSVATFNP